MPFSRAAQTTTTARAAGRTAGRAANKRSSLAIIGWGGGTHGILALLLHRQTKGVLQSGARGRADKEDVHGGVVFAIGVLLARERYGWQADSLHVSVFRLDQKRAVHFHARQLPDNQGTRGRRGDAIE